MRAERLTDKIAILQHGKIIADGTFEEFKQLFAPPKVEHIEKQPSLEKIFFAIVSG